MSREFTPVNQVRLTNVAYVRLNKHGKRFEIACYRNKIISWRNRIETDITEVLQIDTVFQNVSKGMLAKNQDLLEIFGTTDQLIICKEILEKGEIQITEQERIVLIENIFKEISSIIAEKTINTETNQPYTVTIIQSAMKQIQYSVNITKSAKSQALEVIKKLKLIMPIARVKMLLRVLFPVSECYDQLQNLIEKEGGIIENNKNYNSSIEKGYNQIIFKLDPEYYRKINQLVNNLFPDTGRLEVLQLNAGGGTSQTIEVLNNIDDITSIPTTEIMNEGIDNSSLKFSKVRDIDLELAALNMNTEESDDVVVKDLPVKDHFQSLLFDDDEEEDEADENDNYTHDDQNQNINDSVPEVDGSWDFVDTEEVSEIIESSQIEETEVISEVTKPMISAKEKKKLKKKEKRQQRQESVNEVDCEEITLDDIALNAVIAQSLQSNESSPIRKKQSKRSKRYEKEDKQAADQARQAFKTRIATEKQQEMKTRQEINEEIKEEKDSSLQKEMTSVDSSSITTARFSCNTCGGHFADASLYRQHFKSEWHRHNQNRKMKGLPAVTEYEFVRDGYVQKLDD